LGVYEQLKALFNPDYVLGKMLNKIMLVYSSKLNHCVVLGFK